MHSFSNNPNFRVRSSSASQAFDHEYNIPGVGCCNLGSWSLHVVSSRGMIETALRGMHGVLVREKCYSREVLAGIAVTAMPAAIYMLNITCIICPTSATKCPPNIALTMLK